MNESKLRRRHFLSTSTAAMAAAVSVASAQQEEPTRTALIGVGNRGSYLLQAVMAQAGSAAVTAVCDLNPDRLDKAATVAAAFKPKTYLDWRRVVESKELDAVVIATPPQLHAEMAAAALDAGKHVYCEKPIGVTPAEVKTVLDAVRRNPRAKFTVGHQLRSIRQLAESVKKIHEGEIGEVLMVKAQRHAVADLAHDGSSAEWYFDVTKSGGYLIEQSVHNLDVCNWVMRQHPWRACGFGGIRLHKGEPAGRTIFDCGSLVYEYPNRVQMSYTQNVFHPRAMPAGGQYVQVFGSKAGVDLMQAYMVYPQGPRGGAGALLAEKREENPHAHLEAFYAHVRKGGPNPAPVELGAQSALTAILGHWAMVRERVVEWSELGVKITG